MPESSIRWSLKARVQTCHLCTLHIILVNHNLNCNFLAFHPAKLQYCRKCSILATFHYCINESSKLEFYRDLIGISDLNPPCMQAGFHLTTAKPTYTITHSSLKHAAIYRLTRLYRLQSPLNPSFSTWQKPSSPADLAYSNQCSQGCLRVKA